MPNTITALATPPGISGLAVIRISGDLSIEIADKCFKGRVPLCDADPYTIHYGKFYNDSVLIDKVTISVFRNPNSYTGEDVIEISCHGGNIVSGKIIDTLLKNGAKLAGPGEFTQRAFLNGKLDLTQVEAIADLIHSVSVPGALTAARQLDGEFKRKLKTLRQNLIDTASILELELDFADEDVEYISKDKIFSQIDETLNYCKNLSNSYKASEILRSGYFVGIVGYPNSGKSTLFNSLLERKRAIVTNIPGTTRDYLEDIIHINGIAIKLIDTAGLRETEDIIEIEGIKLVESILKQCNLIVVINDISINTENSNSLVNELKQKHIDSDVILAQNKIDKLIEHEADNFVSSDETHFISAKKGIGIQELKNFLANKAKSSTESSKDILINQRHSILLNRASDELENAKQAVFSNQGNEMISYEIRNSIRTLGEIIGETWSIDILNNIFSKFCIGK